ncbi:MAG: VWA domain-containing protein [Blastocatellia bacterium]
MTVVSLRSVASALTALVLLSTVLLAGASPRQQPGSHEKSGQKPTLADPNKEQQNQQGQEAPIRIGTDLVLLDVTVVDPENRPIMNLTQDRFQVLEDKVPQKIEFFSKEQVPVSVVFTIDSSGSMRPKLDTVIKAAINLVKASRSGDEMAVISFKDQPELMEEFTTDINDVIDALNGIVASRQTAMLDALYLSADYGSKEAHNRRKAVILVTDGLDNNSYYKFEEVVNHLKETDVQIYFIGFTNDLSGDHSLFGKSDKDKAENLLNKLAYDTGGRAFYPKELSEVHQIAQQINSDLRTQYSIGYYSTNSKRDGTYRAVKVVVDGRGQRMVARTRSGYTAPKEAAGRALN